MGGRPGNTQVIINANRLLDTELQQIRRFHPSQLILPIDNASSAVARGDIMSRFHKLRDPTDMGVNLHVESNAQWSAIATADCRAVEPVSVCGIGILTSQLSF